MAPTRSADTNVKKRRGRPPGSRNSTSLAKPAAEASASKTKPKGKQTSRRQTNGDKSSTKAAQTRPSSARKRKVDAEPDEIAEEQPQSQPRKKYIQLETRTKRIPQEQIETWPQVSAPVLEQILAVIRDAKKDIANTQRDERRVIAAHNALNPLIRRLTRQLAASRIPPQAKDIHFNIDKLTERNAQISREVTTGRHSKQILSEQVKAAELLLKEEEDNLDQLKKNAKKWKVEWKHQEKHGRLHHLLQDEDRSPTEDGGTDALLLKQPARVDMHLLETDDEELGPLLEQLRRSLENMHNNHAQIEDIDEAMKDAHAALDDVLFRHATTQQYAAL